LLELIELTLAKASQGFRMSLASYFDIILSGIFCPHHPALVESGKVIETSLVIVIETSLVIATSTLTSTLMPSDRVEPIYRVQVIETSLVIESRCDVEVILAFVVVIWNGPCLCHGSVIGHDLRVHVNVIGLGHHHGGHLGHGSGSGLGHHHLHGGHLGHHHGGHRDHHHGGHHLLLLLWSSSHLEICDALGQRRLEALGHPALCDPSRP